MPTLRIRVSVELDGVELPGYPYEHFSFVDEAVISPIEELPVSASFVKASGVPVVALPSIAIIHAIEGDVDVLFNNNEADAGDGSVGLAAGGLAMIIGGTLSANDIVALKNTHATLARSVRTLLAGT